MSKKVLYSRGSVAASCCDSKSCVVYYPDGKWEYAGEYSLTHLLARQGHVGRMGANSESGNCVKAGKDDPTYGLVSRLDRTSRGLASLLRNSFGIAAEEF